MQEQKHKEYKKQYRKVYDTLHNKRIEDVRWVRGRDGGEYVVSVLISHSDAQELAIQILAKLGINKPPTLDLLDL